MIRLARRRPQRIWAVEGAAGVGRAARAAAGRRRRDRARRAAQLSTRARIFDVGHGRKNDPGDARTVAVVAIRTKGLRQVVPDDEMVALRLMSERRRDLVRSRTQTVNHLHQLLMELIPRWGGAESDREEGQGATRQVRPRDIAGRTRRHPAADLVEDLAGLHRTLKDPVQALKVRGRCDRNHLDRHQGRRHGDRRTDPWRGRGRPPVPVPAPLRHLHRRRPDRGVLRRGRTASTVPSRATASSTTPCTSSRCPTSATTPAAAPTTLKKLAAGKGKKGALRSLKRRLSDSVYRHLLDDQQQRAQGSPGGHLGATLQSSAAGSHPNAGTSEQPHTGLHENPDARPPSRVLTQRGAVQ